MMRIGLEGLPYGSDVLALVASAAAALEASTLGVNNIVAAHVEDSPFSMARRSKLQVTDGLY